MSGAAQVRSTAAIEQFRAQLAKFREQSVDAVESLEGELRRMVDWLEHDRPAYWKVQIRQAEDGVHQAKMDLERCLIFPTVEGERPACREEKDALRAAHQRLEYCREKASRVRQWQRTMEHELYEYQGRISQLRQILEIDVLQSQSVLQRVIARLEAYTVEKPPEGPSQPTAATPGEPTTAHPDAGRPSSNQG